MRSHNKMRGFSLVELMVAVVIGLIGTVVIFQVYAVSEGQKRSTVSGGDAQQNGAIGLFTIERELRNAGHGLTFLIARGAPIYGWNNVAGAARPALVMRPLTIIAGATSDSIEVNYSTFEGLTSPVSVTTKETPTSPAGWDPASVAPTNVLQIAAVAGFNAGNKIVVCPPEVDPLGPPPGPADNTCILAEITGFGVDLALQNQVFLATPPTTFLSSNGGGFDTSKFNPAAGFSVLNATLALIQKRFLRCTAPASKRPTMRSCLI